MHAHRRTLISLLAVVAVVGAIAPAAAEPLSRGTIEFSPSLAFNRSTYTPQGGGESASSTHLNFNASLSRFMTEKWQLTGSFLFQHRSLASEGQNGVGASAGATLNFPTQSNVTPFIAAAIGAISYSANGQTDKALLVPMIRVGFRTMMWERRAVNVSVGYQHEKNSESAFEQSANVFDVGVGMSIFNHK